MRDLPDSSLVFRLTRGRLWIGVLAVLLAGIVGLSVLNLSLSSSSSRVSVQMTALERSNSELTARIEQQLSTERVQAAAAKLGLENPAPSDITYLTAGSGDFTAAAKLLAGGGPQASFAAAPSPSSTTAIVAAPVASIAPAPRPVTPAPVAAKPAAPAPKQATTASHPTTNAGGISPG